MKQETKETAAKLLISLAKISSYIAGYPFVWLAWKVNPPPKDEFTQIESVMIDAKRIEANLRVSGLSELVKDIAEIFIIAKGENYVSLETFSPDLGIIELVIQRKDRGTKTPAEMAIVLRKALADAHAKCCCGATDRYAHLTAVKPFVGYDYGKYPGTGVPPKKNGGNDEGV